MPRSADHGDATEALLEDGADGPAHVRLAALFDEVRPGSGRPQRRHRFLQRREQPDGIEPLLDLLLPPLLRILVSRCPRERLQRIGAARFAGFARGQLDRLRQIHEPRRDAMSRRPRERLPFRREHGERIEDASRRRVGRIDEEGNGRSEVLISGKPDQVVAVGRALDQERVRIERVERSPQRACASRPVVTDAEEMYSSGHSSTSMQARYRSFQPSRSLTTVFKYSSQTTRSWTGSFTTAPVSPAAMSPARSIPSPK